MVDLDMMKNYLRVDTDEDDALITSFIETSKKLCLDIARNESVNSENESTIDLAVMYAVAYLYEHKEEADHKALILSLRSLLFGIRKELF